MRSQVVAPCPALGVLPDQVPWVSLLSSGPEGPGADVHQRYDRPEPGRLPTNTARRALEPLGSHGERKTCLHDGTETQLQGPPTPGTLT